ncbi:hypothetical protein ACFQLX_20890 [Streptomyces polyrhachis]|uniref:Chromosome partition protein Smc n=1 Tax=Streptomyces polyrhachis TaxID=1282885 RepID=A0ABW2GNB5_9ACTN
MQLPVDGGRWASTGGRVTAHSARRWGWGSGRGDSGRSGAQAAKDAAANAFYELDSTQRDLRISIETIAAVDDSPAARTAVGDFAELGRRIDEASAAYIAAVDAHDLDRDDLTAAAADRARQELQQATNKLERVRADLDHFAHGLGSILQQAETQLARLAPAVERARQALLAAGNALDAVRDKGYRADDLAARLARLAPELTRLNEGAGVHGVQATVHRAVELQRTAEELRAQAEQLPRRAEEIDRRLGTLRTRAQALATRAERTAPVLSELRRRFAMACWEDLQPVPEQAARAVAEAEGRIREAAGARAEQRWADATALLATARALLNQTDEAITAAQERLRRLNEVQASHRGEVDRTRFAVRDAQRLAMAGRSTPDPRHARPLDEAMARLDRAVEDLGGRHPDYWHFLMELEAVRDTAARVVQAIREGLSTGH